MNALKEHSLIHLYLKDARLFDFKQSTHLCHFLLANAF